MSIAFIFNLNRMLQSRDSESQGKQSWWKNPKLAGFVFISPSKVLKNDTKFEVAVDSAVGCCEVAKIIFSFSFSQILNINPLKEPIKRILQIKENSSCAAHSQLLG